ncbi:DYW domain-containing protein [Plasmodiophora brassicae]
MRAWRAIDHDVVRRAATSLLQCRPAFAAAARRRCCVQSAVPATSRRRFDQRKVGGAIRALRDEDDADRGWQRFQAVLESRADVDVRLFQSMLTFCGRHAPAKAPSVLAACVSRGVPVSDALFKAFLRACLKADPPRLDDVLQQYAACGPRTPDTIFTVALACLDAKRPAPALSLVPDVVTNAVPLTEPLAYVLAASCAACRAMPAAADAADTLVDLIPAAGGAIRNPQVFSDLVRALLAHKRLDKALGVVRLMETSVDLPPTDAIYRRVLVAAAGADRVDDALRLYRTMLQRRMQVAMPAVLALVAACARCGDVDAVRALHLYVTDPSATAALNGSAVAAFAGAYARCGTLDDLRALHQFARDHDLMRHGGVVGAFVDAFGRRRDRAAVQALEAHARRHGLELQVARACAVAYDRCDADR